MNPLADAIVAPLENREDTVLIDAQGGELKGSELFRLSGQIANVLKNSGVVPGDRVAMQTQKSVPSLALYLACLRCGALFLPLNTAYTISELDYFLGDAEPRVTVCDPAVEPELQPLAEKIGSKLLTLGSNGSGSLADLAAAAAAEFNNANRSGDDLAAILYTSGTTGRSKGDMLSHTNLLSNTESLVKAWQFTAADTLLHALPIFHAHGLFVAINVNCVPA